MSTVIYLFRPNAYTDRRRSRWDRCPLCLWGGSHFRRSPGAGRV